MKRLSIFLLCALACALSIHAYKQQKVTIKVNGENREMQVYTPNTVSSNLPLMIVTHGMNQDAGYQASCDHMYELIDKESSSLPIFRVSAEHGTLGAPKTATSCSRP